VGWISGNSGAFPVDVTNQQKVPQGYSPADENSGSLTPFGMTNAYWEVIGCIGLRAELLAKGTKELFKRNVLKRY
jgi:hypothetical protein